jgi:hypothetical protein
MFPPTRKEDLTMEVTKHIFFFAAVDQKTARVLPCVSKNWKKVYEEWVEARGEMMHGLLFHKSNNKEVIEKEGFDRFGL